MNYGALPICTLVKLPTAGLAEDGEVAGDFSQVLFRPDLFVLAEHRSAGLHRAFYRGGQKANMEKSPMGLGRPSNDGAEASPPC